MKLRLSTGLRNPIIRRSKSLKRKRKDFENEIKELIVNSLVQNNTNKELVEKNVSLLAEIETLKKEKLDLFERFMFKQNPNQLVIKNDLMVLLESLKSDRKEMIELFQTTNDFFNKMFDKISDKIEEVVGYEDRRIELNNEWNESPENKRLKCQQIYELRQTLRQSGQQNDDCIQNNDLSLSVIPEATQEFSKEVTNQIECESVDNRFETPIRKSPNSSIDYELTPLFSESNFRTPSIFNFDSNSFRNERLSQNNETSYLILDNSERPDFDVSKFESFDSTITEKQNGMTSSTPVCQMRMSLIQRPSKRISSINKPFSPRLGRPSLIDIQNVIENKKCRKQSTICETKTLLETNDKFENQTNDSNCLKSTKKRRKKDDTKSIDSDISETSGNSTASNSLPLRSSRRNRKQVSYTEPKANRKLRRPTD